MVSDEQPNHATWGARVRSRYTLHFLKSYVLLNMSQAICMRRVNNLPVPASSCEVPDPATKRDTQTNISNHQFNPKQQTTSVIQRECLFFWHSCIGALPQSWKKLDCRGTEFVHSSRSVLVFFHRTLTIWRTPTDPRKRRSLAKVHSS